MSWYWIKKGGAPERVLPVSLYWNPMKKYILVACFRWGAAESEQSFYGIVGLYCGYLGIVLTIETRGVRPLHLTLRPLWTAPPPSKRIIRTCGWFVDMWCYSGSDTRDTTVSASSSRVIRNCDYWLSLSFLVMEKKEIQCYWRRSLGVSRSFKVGQ